MRKCSRSEIDCKEEKRENMKKAIDIVGLRKEYKDFTMDVTATVPRGFATALIGANGAGKTTLIDSLCGVNSVNSGVAVFFENEASDDSERLERIGYCSSGNYFPVTWKLKTIAECMTIGFDGFNRERFDELCTEWGLGTSKDKKQKTLMKMSDGNRVRTALAAVFARDTDILVLDEPASTLDPLARDRLCDMFRGYLSEKDGERSILFSTHNIADMESATDYAIFMADGRVIEQGFVEDLKNKYALVHTDAEDKEKALPFLLTYTSNDTGLEGLALAENSALLEAAGAVLERPTLQQLSVGVLRKAENNAR